MTSRPLAGLIAGIGEGEREGVARRDRIEQEPPQHVITAIKRPTLILAPNKTLAAQLSG